MYIYVFIYNISSSCTVEEAWSCKAVAGVFHMHTYVHIYTYTYIYVYIYICTYVCI